MSWRLDVEDGGFSAKRKKTLHMCGKSYMERAEERGVNRRSQRSCFMAVKSLSKLTRRIIKLFRLM